MPIIRPTTNSGAPAGPIRVTNVTKSTVRFHRHIAHGTRSVVNGEDKMSAPVGEWLVLEPGETCEVERDWDGVLFAYECEEAQCREREDKRCRADHDSRVVVGGAGALCCVRADRHPYPLSPELADALAETEEAETRREKTQRAAKERRDSAQRRFQTGAGKPKDEPA